MARLLPAEIQLKWNVAESSCIMKPVILQMAPSPVHNAGGLHTLIL